MEAKQGFQVTGRHSSSASRKAIKGEQADRIPLFRAEETPPLD
jgi:hypothetical protein